MAKRETEFISERKTVGGLAPIEPRGPVVPVRRGERTRWLQDGQWLPSWLVWLRRRRGLLLALLLLAGLVVAFVRLLGGAK